LNVRPEDVHLLATEADAIKIIKHIRVSDEDSQILQDKWLINNVDKSILKNNLKDDSLFE
jgi:hypothetical protein